MTARTAADLRGAAQVDRWLRAALLVAAVLVFGGLYARLFTASLPGGFVSRQAVARAIPVAAPFYWAQLLPNAAARSVHSATAAEISGGRLRAFWYGGSREGASDVAIYTSVYSPKEGTWNPERVVMTRELAQRQLRRT